MPELPEIESIRRGLRELVVRRILEVKARDPMVFAGDLTPARAVDVLTNQRIESIDRRGKYLLFQLRHGWLFFSLRMTGKLFLRERVPEPHREYCKLQLRLEDTPKSMSFLTVRRLARVYWTEHSDPGEHPRIRKLGPDPLDPAFDPDVLIERSTRRKGPLKTVLMDQSFIAGVGNIYASEVCFRSGIDPRRTIPELPRRTLKAVGACVVRVLREAVEAGGSSFTNFRGANARPGRYHRFHRVYNRSGEPCVVCGSSIESTVLSGRSTYFCPSCQQ